MNKLRSVNFIVFLFLLFDLSNCRSVNKRKYCEVNNLNDSLMFFLKVDSSNKEYFDFFISQNDVAGQVSFNSKKALVIENEIYNYLCRDSFYSKDTLFHEFKEFRRQYLGVCNHQDSFIFILYTLLPKELKYDKSQRVWNYSFAFFLHTKGAYQYLIIYSATKKKILRIIKYQ